MSGEDYGKREPEIRGELSIEDLVRRQIERTNFSASYDPEVFNRNVEICMSLLPKHKREEVVTRSDEYTDITEEWQYKYACGVALGTPENPAKDIDGRIMSPFLVEVPFTDYDKLYEIILDAFEECGLTWKIEKVTRVRGRVKKFADKPTPWFGDERKEEKKT